MKTGPEAGLLPKPKDVPPQLGPGLPVPTSASGLRDRRWLLRSPRVISSMMTRVGWP